MLEDTKTNRFDDKRIHEALELLNAVARDNKAELQAVISNKYTDLSSMLSAFAGRMKDRAAERYDTGKQKVVAVATDIDKSVHDNPWTYIAGVAATALLTGLLLGRSRRD